MVSRNVRPKRGAIVRRYSDVNVEYVTEYERTTMSRRKPNNAPKAPAAVPSSSVRTVRIETLIPDAGNVRRRDERARSALESSVRQFGPARSIVIDGRDIVRAGNGVLEAAQAAGCTEVLVVKPGPNQLVAVQRDDWSPTEACAAAIADNRTGDLSHFDDTSLLTQLRCLQSESFDLTCVGFRDDEVDTLNERLASDLLEHERHDLERPAPPIKVVAVTTCPNCGHEWEK
jgi:hypothetical protein